jgi:hypothetical protein
MDEPRFPLNAPGDFYVADGLCIICGAPEDAAPDLMAHDPASYHCYFRRQPVTPAERDRAVRAVEVNCCGAVRYAGRDPAVIAKLRLAGRGDHCDHADRPARPEPSP